MEKNYTFQFSFETNSVIRVIMLTLVVGLNLLMLGVEFFSSLHVWQRVVLAIVAVVIIAFGILMREYGDNVKEIAHNSCVCAAISAIFVFVVTMFFSYINHEDQILTKTTIEFWACGELLITTLFWLLLEDEKMPPVWVGILLNLVLLLPWLYLAFPEVRTAFFVAVGIFLQIILHSLWKCRRKLFR